MFGKNVTVMSAGSEPSGVVQPWAIKVMKEIGVDISAHQSKSMNRLPLGFMASMDFVITLCAEEVFASMPNKAERIHWPIPDPASAPENKKQEAFRAARDEIAKRLEAFGREHGL